MEVVESIPVHEDIKLGKLTRDKLIANYAQNIISCGKGGVKCVCYNFMPVFDWAARICTTSTPTVPLRFHTILINGAGGNNPKATCDNETMSPEMLETEGLKDFFALDESGLKFVFDLNITSAFLVTQVFAEGMVKTGGNIINISSMNAFRPLTKIPAYSAAKAGVSNFTQWLAVHFAPCHIRCNAIAPGFFVTNQNRALLYNEDGTPTARTGKILAATPMKKFGEISDLIGCLLWLSDDKASGFVTGTVIPVDGGFSAYSGV